MIDIQHRPTISACAPDTSIHPPAPVSGRAGRALVGRTAQPIAREI